MGSLFAGIGGFDLGLERTGGFKVIWHSEIDAYASAVLKKHWPEVENYGDITKINWKTVKRSDVLCGGFPCQDISVAGKGRGISGARSGLWKEFLRAIEGTRPKWVIIENSPMLVERGLGQVLHDLRNVGYKPLRPLLLQASDVGARHKRERIFIVAHANLRRRDDGDASGSGGQLLPDGGGLREENKQEQDERQRGVSEDASPAANPDSFGKQRNLAQEIYGECGISWWHNDGEFAQIREGRHLPKPLVCRGVYGVSNGMDRIKCLGNAVVPAVAQVVGELILEMVSNSQLCPRCNRKTARMRVELEKIKEGME